MSPGNSVPVCVSVCIMFAVLMSLFLLSVCDNDVCVFMYHRAWFMMNMKCENSRCVMLVFCHIAFIISLVCSQLQFMQAGQNSLTEQLICW